MDLRKTMITVIAGTVFALGTTHAMATTTLKLSHNHNRDHAVHKAMTQMAKDVRELTAGEVRIRIY